MEHVKSMPHEEDPIIRSDEGQGLTFADIVESRISRRDLLKSGVTASMTVPLAGALSKLGYASETEVTNTGLSFEPIPPSTLDTIVLPIGYKYDVVLKWGEPIEPGMGAFDATNLTASYQAKAVGYNCDFIGFMPLPYGSTSSNHGLLGVNFEYVNPEMMFPIAKPQDVNKSQTEVCLEAVGFGVFEIKRRFTGWELVLDSKYNKRYTATTEMRVGGPARGHARMKTSKHTEGNTCTGTMANCAAGKTPWGTVLSGEENFQGMFGNAETLTENQAKRGAKRYGLGAKISEYAWEKHFDRFDCAKEPNEANHFGWVVEIDPYDPDFVPVKRTALGRCRHEAATSYVSKSGHIVMYTGDDARFEYVYKFVSKKRFNPENRKANRELLDEGTLYVAKFNDDGSGVWIPLVFGQGPLTSANGFNDQGDVVIDARIAGDLVGATKMDRPEDIEMNPVNGKIYVACTNNVDRGKEGKEGATVPNPRKENKHGHIIEITENGNDLTSTTFRWELFLVCGDPNDASTHYAGFPKDQVAPISCPDNICFDQQGNLWIATDGQENTLQYRDGFFAVPTAGPERGKLRQFMASVVGSEVCGPEFTPDGTTAFLAIQHPGEGSSFANPSTRWPDHQGIPRPSVIAIEAINGGVIGS